MWRSLNPAATRLHKNLHRLNFFLKNLFLIPYRFVNNVRNYYVGIL